MYLSESVLQPANQARPLRRQSLYCASRPDTNFQLYSPENQNQKNKSKIQIRYSFKITPKSLNSSFNKTIRIDQNLNPLIKIQSTKENKKIPLNQYAVHQEIGLITNSIEQILKKIDSIKKQCQNQQFTFKMKFETQKVSSEQKNQLADKFYYQNQEISKQFPTNSNLVKKKSSQIKQTKLLDLQVLKTKNKELKIGDFELGKKIGSGKFGDVLQCRHKQTGVLYALKKILKSTISDYGMIGQFTEQLKIHYQLKHPNIIELITHFEDDYHIFMLMEYAIGGNILNCVKKQERQVSKIINEVVNGLIYLHQKNICHRDIKPENILIGVHGQIKLCDFGWSCQLKNGQKTNTFCGTPDYISPQMKNGNYYDFSVDLWSLGILTYQLITGSTPFKDDVSKWLSYGTKKQYNWNWKTIQYPISISVKSRHFIQNLLRQNVFQRFTLQQCKNSLFLKT